MTRKIHSEIVKFREKSRLIEDILSDIDDKESENTDSSSTTDDSSSNMTRSQIQSLIHQEIQNSKRSNDNNSPSSDSPTPKKDKAKSSSSLYRPSERPIIKLPKKNHKRSHVYRKSPSMKDYESLYSPKYEELEPVNIYSKTKSDLISFDDNRVVSLLKKYDKEFCIISPIINSPYVTNDMNMKRCLNFINKLEERDYLYFPVYLSTRNTEQIYDVIFIVFPISVKNRNQKHSFMNLFDLMIELSDKKMFNIRNMIFKEDTDFYSYVLRTREETLFLKSNTKRDVILDLCRVNNNKVNEISELLTNPACQNQNEYIDRYINKNELCLVSSVFTKSENSLYKS